MLKTFPVLGACPTSFAILPNLMVPAGPDKCLSGTFQQLQLAVAAQQDHHNIAQGFQEQATRFSGVCTSLAVDPYLCIWSNCLNTIQQGIMRFESTTKALAERAFKVLQKL